MPIGLVAMLAVAGWCRGARRGRPASAASASTWSAPALLGLAVLSLLLPLVSIEGGQRLPLLLLVLVVPLLVAFVALGAADRPPRRGPAARRRAAAPDAGYGNGLAVGSLYFTGFTGVFLVLSVFFQDELGYSPLTAGLLLTPFALGSALTAPLAGRLVSRIHRRITVIALVVMMPGVLAVALLVPGRGPTGCGCSWCRRCSSPASAAAGWSRRTSR